MQNLSENIADLSSEQRELLELLLREQGVDVSRTVILPEPRRPEGMPLSYAQQRLWFLDQLTPDSAMYNIPLALRLSGRLDRAILKQVLDEVVRRHEILRTTFAEGDGPVQVIAPQLTVEIDEIDLRSLAPEQREAEVLRLVRADAQQPFDLSEGPLLRATLVRLAEQDHVLLVSMHHIVSDGWSMGVLTAEVVALYRAFLQGQPSPLPELGLQYADYAAWQRRQLQGQQLEALLGYWRSQLAGIPSRLELPTDRPRPAVQTAHGATYMFDIDRATLDGVLRVGRSVDATLFMTLLAAFQALLGRYSGQEDICVGTPIANRTRAELEPLIGFFVNTLVLRADLSGGPGFRQLLRQVRGTTLEAYEHQDVPFEMLVETLKPERDMSYTPLFQVMFSMQHAAEGHAELPGLQIEPLAAHSGTAKFDLMLNAAETSTGLSCWLEYNTDLFDESTIQRMAGHFQTLLEAIVANPDQAITRLPILGQAEQRQILASWASGPQVAAPVDTIHARFAAQAAATPDALALIAPVEGSGDPEVLTFAALDARANQLAHALRQLGAGPDAVVGLLTPRSADTIAGILAVLKAGGAYLPLDPAYPPDRLAFMLQDSGVSIVLTQEPLLHLLPEGFQRFGEAEGTVALCLDADQEALAQFPAQAPTELALPDHLAYVIYTSGSTGTPKGVMVSHRAALNLAAALHHVAYAGLDHPLRLSLNAPLSFDASVQQWIMLTQGHTLVIIPQEVRTDADAFVAFIRHHHLDQLDCVPSQLKLLLDAGLLHPDHWHPAIVFPGGEPIDDPTWDALSHAPNTRFFNMYGPTECTVDSTSALVLPSQAHSANPIASPSPSIGRPLANAQVFVLDRHLQPVPAGVPGELFIAGPGLARGYLHRPHLTADRFLPNPFAALTPDQPASRLYRTGDLVRWLPNGHLQFLGRTDFQVKLRGFRIELGEIEQTLRAHPGLKDAVVLARDDTAGHQRLVAYIIPADPAQPPALPELRRFLSQRLPDYMVPAAFVALDAFPLTPNAKIDRHALPAPETSRDELEGAYVAPATPTEEILAGLWASLLGLDRVGIQDNFFDLGGHSLSATQVISRVRETFGIELPLRTLFERPTIAGLAEAIDEMLREAAAVVLPPIVPLPRDGDGLAPLSFAQQRLWFLDQLEPGNLFYNTPTAVRLTGALDLDVLGRALDEVVRRHEVLRTTFRSVDGIPVQVVSANHHIDLPMIDLQAIPADRREEEALRLATAEIRRPFDLEAGPLIRGLLLRLSEDDYLAVLTIHHIVTDGWSTGILIKELATLYEAFAAGRLSPLPELPLQYADYATWERRWLGQADKRSKLRPGADGATPLPVAVPDGSPLQGQLAYWQEQLADIPPLLELPTDRPRPAVQSANGATLAFNLPQELSAAVKALGRQEGTTLYMTLLAAYQALLARYSGQDDVCVGSVVANRGHTAWEPLIGFFVNTLVLRTRFDGNSTFRELLAQVRSTTLDAYAHQNVPFEMLVDALQPERSLSHTPLFQVAFSLQNTPMPEATLPGLALRGVNIDRGATQFDMVLTMSDTLEGLGGAWEYNTDLFDESTIRRMAGHLQALLAAMVADPDQAVAAATLLTAEERQRILVEWNDTATPFPDDRTLHALFEERVAQQPEHPAAVFVQSGRAETLSYAQLDQRANQLAHLLRSHGAGPGSLVAIALQRSLHLPVAILGVLKAGAAFLPVDPAYPAERVRFMLEDSGAPIVLTHRNGEDKAKNTQSSKGTEDTAVVIELGTAWEFARGWPASPPEDGAGADDLAYCIYTSGSTGTPKGALLQHRGLANLAQVQRRTLEITPHSRILQFSPLSFDASVWDFTMALANGATLVLAPQETLASGPDLLQLLRDQHITTVTLPPSLLAVLEPGELPALRTVIAGGERCTRDIVQRWAPGRRFVNAYGPTETTVVASLAQCPAEDEGEPTIGRPLDNFQLYVVDANLQPVPIGVPGELLIAGVGLARGYLNRPELTAERFRTVAIDGQARRVYRSGDLVRWRPDGTLDFLGRMDHQVKVRGFRIELGEIETVLTTHPAVRDAAVIIHELAPGDRRLAAYLVFERTIDPAPSIGDLRTFLAQRLPDYMIPAAFVNLENLPLTPAGKIDRRALPAPDAAARLETGQAYQAPRTEAEQILAAIWADVLRVERIGVHDNFFEIGGDSIMSIQVVARAGQAGLRFTPKQMFQTPTIAGLAAAAEVVEAARVDAEQGLVEGPVLPAPIQRWFLELDLPERHHWNQSVLLAVKERLDSQRLRAAIAALLAHHDALRLRLMATVEGWQLANAGLEGEVPLEIVDLSSLREDERSAAVEAHAEDVQRSLDLSQGPLIRVVYWDFGPDQAGRLLLVIHHLAIDAVSWRILLEDLQTAYALAGEEPATVPLPAKTTSYRRWAEQLAAYAQSEEVRGELDYWLDQGAGWASPLPIDHTQGANTELSAETVSVALGEAETRQLLQEVHAAYGTEIDDILLAALAQACAQWMGGSALLVAREGHGRSDVFADESQVGGARIDLSRTVGWCTALVPVRLQLPFAAGAGAAIMTVKEQLRAVPHGGIGFGLLRYLAGDPDIRAALAVLPQPELSFNYLGQFDQVLPEDSPLAPARESSGPDRGPGNLRPHLIDVTGAVTGGRMAFAWTFSRNRHEAATVQQLANGFLQALRELIDHCLSPAAGGYTPSDFGLASLSQSQLDKIVQKARKR